MLKKITVKAGLIALLSLMTMLLIMVSVIGVNAINEGSRSIHTLNQILGEELGSLANSSNLTLRARTAASLAVRQRRSASRCLRRHRGPHLRLPRAVEQGNGAFCRRRHRDRSRP